MFDFGKNWLEYSRALVNPERLSAATCSLQNLLQRECLQGCTFLDIGCGSGLFSIAASRLGAARVLGIDINPVSIEASELNLAKFGAPTLPTFRQMSALDRIEMARLGHFDVVYAWGSLHHTGAMWQAIDNTSQCVAPSGILVLALYNLHWSSPYWQVIKRYYSPLPRCVQEIVAVPFSGIILLAKLLATRQNPFAKERGMDFWYDVIDWLGGYPYEYASARTVTTQMQRRGFELDLFVPAQVPTGCNEFVFRRTACSEL